MKSRNLYALILLIAVILVIISLVTMRTESRKILLTDRELITQSGVCPPFNLYDEDGNIIDPVNEINADKPYSPKQTCGKCHDYDKITQGFHFQQGKMKRLQEFLQRGINGFLLPDFTGVTGVLRHLYIITCRIRTTPLQKKWI